MIVAGRHEYGVQEAQASSRRLRATLDPRGAASRPACDVLAGGAPAAGRRLPPPAYTYFPWLVAARARCSPTSCSLRAFRSLLLPLKAVLLNLLSVGAAYGMLVVVFRWGVGATLLGLYQFAQIEGWIPIFLFAMLFGLSMDYEVFLVSRMREAWDEAHDNARAVADRARAHRPDHHGRGDDHGAPRSRASSPGAIVGLQEFGSGSRSRSSSTRRSSARVLVPRMMAIFGRWNWWLPERVARVVRVRPSPLRVG